jgi:hypothetical protein
VQIKITNVDTISALFDRLICEHVKLYFFRKENNIDKINHQQLVIQELRNRVSITFRECFEEHGYDYIAEKRTFHIDGIKEELEKFNHDTNWLWTFYKIDSETLDNSKLVIMVPLESNNIARRQFIIFNKTNFDKYCHIGGVTRQRYQNAKDNNEQPNTFAGVPHVLYKGSIDTSNLEIVEF